MATFQITSNPTFRDVRGRFAEAEEELLKGRRDEMRTEGRYLVSNIQMRIQRKLGKPSKIEQGVKFRTTQTANQVQLSVSTPARARPHRIRAVNASALAFFWPKVGKQTFVPRRGGFKTHETDTALFIGKGYVDHPGGSLEPLLKPIVQDAAADWQRERGRTVLRRISTRYVTAVKSK